MRERRWTRDYKENCLTRHWPRLGNFSPTEPSIGSMDATGPMPTRIKPNPDMAKFPLMRQLRCRLLLGCAPTVTKR